MVYGKYAIVSAISQSMNQEEKKYLVKQNGSNLDKIRQREVNRVLKRWKKFEAFIRKDRKSENAEYFSNGSFDYDNYYKGKTLNEDIK